jgi:basic membrane protein A
VKKITAGTALVAAAALLLSGCGAAPDESTPAGSASESASSSAAASDFLACMVSDEGGFDDASFNESAYKGLEQAVTDLGVQKKEAESKNANDYQPNLKAMHDAKCSLTITVGFNLANDTKSVAEANTDDHYAILDDDSIDLPNVKPIIFKTSDAAFLAGYLAAGYSKSGTVATFGGMEIPTVTIFMDGFADGVKQYNEDNNKSVKLLGWDKETKKGVFTGDFSDLSKGQNATKNFIDQGADVVMPVAGPVGNGAAAAAKEKGGVALVWVDADGYLTNPDYKDLMLTSVMKEMQSAVFNIISEAKDGNYSNTPYVGSLANDGVGIAPLHDFESKVDSTLVAKVDEYKTKIASGEYKVTSPSDPKVS